MGEYLSLSGQPGLQGIQLPAGDKRFFDLDKTAASRGFDEAWKKYPEVKIAATTFMDWSNEKVAQQMAALLASGKQFDGVWTSGIDYTVIEAMKTAHKPFVPFVGADNAGFISN
jgi:ribose transport system substrate-binding protein